MTIKASWTEIRRGSVLKLTFRLTSIINDTKHDKKGGKEDANDMLGPFEIDDLAQVRFKFVQVPRDPNEMAYDDDPVSVKISSKLSDSVLRKYNGQIVNLYVGSKELDFSKKWICSEEWTDWVDMGETEVIPEYADTDISSDDFILPIILTMTVSKKETLTFAKLYDDTELTDFQLSTAEGGVKVHKVLLAAHSNVFKTMLCSEWKESANASVQIQEVTLQTLQDLKKYIYLNILPDNIEELRSLLVLASFYVMDILLSECISKIIGHITSENLQSMLEHACAFNIPELTYAIIEQIPSEVVHNAHLNRKIKKEVKEEQTEQQVCKSGTDLEKEE